MTHSCFATDEDIALRASHDFFILCPTDQVVAKATDGRFLSSDRWALRSASVDFSIQGAHAGQVVLLTRPAALFKPPGEAFVVDRVEAGALVLRRKGQASGAGHPPGPTEGVEAVEFSIATFSPQIELASVDLTRRLGVGATGSRSQAEITNPDELREATALSVLRRRYLEMSREADPKGDLFASKAGRVASELESVLSRLAVHFTTSTGSEAINVFRKRLVR